MKAAAGLEGRWHDWVTAFRRPSWRRAVIRPLPNGLAQRLLAANRGQRRAVARLRSRWHRSLQLRVVATTLVLSALVIVVLGFFLVQSIANALFSSAVNSDGNQVSAGRLSALGQRDPNVLQEPSPPGSRNDAEAVAHIIVSTLQQASGNTGSYLVFIKPTNITPDDWNWVVGQGNIDPATIPQALINKVTLDQRPSRYDNATTAPPSYQSTTLVYASGSGSAVPALAFGVPLSAYYQLYYVFPLTQQQGWLQQVQRILVGVGLALVVLLAAIASLVTRWVVVPIRHAAQAAQRLAAGHLEERMQVRGTDDLAALATSFNDMAASLQAKLHELQELSRFQRQFVSDVSHELRTPLQTIMWAAELLYESRAGLDPSGVRSAELLQSQLERFGDLVADLLEISRYDAGVATLEPEPVDVCDLVRRSADDAQQLAERRGSRIEFRLPVKGCYAEADRRRVERILRNLLGNAVEHGQGKDVVVTTAMDSDAVAVSVRDYGVGLRPGEEQRVFERFWQADQARTSGTGLGLAISLEDARLHGGWLQAWGEPGKGSVFRLTLPRVAGQPLAGSPLPLGPDETEVISTLVGADGHRDQRDGLA